MKPTVVKNERFTQKERVLALLESAKEKILSGDISPNHAIVVLCQNDIDTLRPVTLCEGRSMEILGLLEIAKNDFLNYMME